MSQIPMQQMQQMQQMSMMPNIPGFEEEGSSMLTFFLICCCCLSLSICVYVGLSVSSNKKSEGKDIGDINTYNDLDADDLILKTDRLKGLYTNSNELDECDEDDFECLIKDMDIEEINNENNPISTNAPG
jgi:hypothetical protein